MELNVGDIVINIIDGVEYEIIASKEKPLKKPNLPELRVPKDYDFVLKRTISTIQKEGDHEFFKYAKREHLEKH